MAPPSKPASIAALVRGRGVRQWGRRLFGFLGPGYLIAVGYVDPGNWATDLAAGSGFAYSLLWVVMLSNLMAILLQVLAIRLGIVTGQDLAQACRARSSRLSSIAQWIACEIAICACDIAEVIGTAIALQLLFGLPLPWGVLLTAFDAALLFYWHDRRGMRYLEAAVAGLLVLVFASFCVMLTLAQPDWRAVARGLLPDPAIIGHPGMLYLASGIIGATVMPHNLYLHSALVRERAPAGADKQDAIRLATVDIVAALLFAFLINGAILVLAGAALYGGGIITEIGQARALLAPALGAGPAGLLFAFALLASGQSSMVTATLAGQVVMEGFLQLRVRPWLRRLATRALAITPALLATLWYGQNGIARLLIFSQVVLSLQLPFAIVPLVRYTSDRTQMGPFANRRWLTALACATAALIIALNAKILLVLWTAP